MCGENVLCRTGRVKKCGVEKINSPLSVCLEHARRKERFSFFARKQVLRVELHSSRRDEAERQTRDFSISIKPETQKSPHPKKGLSVNPELSERANVVTYLKRFLLSVIFYNEYSNVCNV